MKVTHVKQGPFSSKAWLPRLSGRTRIVLRWIAIVLTWPPLALFSFISGMAIGWLLLAAIVLKAPPNFADVDIALVVLVLNIVFAVLAGMAAGSLRKAGLFVGGIILLVLLGFAIWAPTHPARAEFLARQIGWGPSHPKDYLRFPERVVATTPPVFYFTPQSGPAPFDTVQFASGGEMHSLRLEQFMQSTQTTSFIMIKDDAILYEDYFNGYQRDSIVTSFSMAKSFTSALVGIAISEGYIGGVDDKVIQYVPELGGRGLDELTIRDLLLMSSGIRYAADDEVSDFVEMFQFTDDGLSYSYPELREQALHLQAGDVPVGAEFNYNNYHPQVLGIILERTTGMSPSEYLQEKIWKPLGMEYPGSWSLDSERGAFELMTAGINGRAVDFARFGRLFLHNGNWEGAQLIPESWVIESTSPDPNDTRPWHVNADWKEGGGYYKYLWWGSYLPDGGYAYAAHGHLGQRIYVSPQDGVVIVRFGFDEGGVDNWDAVFRYMIDEVKK